MFHLPRFSLFLALLGLSAPAIFAQSAVTDSPLMGATSISGHVTLDGKPAAGVTVLLLSNYAPLTFTGHPSEFVPKTVTDAQGNYRIEGLSAGSYKVLPSGPALVLAGENYSTFGPGKSVSAGDGESVNGIDFSLVKAAVIGGHVTLAGGQPAAALTVWITPADHGGWLFDPATGKGRESEKTDENGDFRIYGLAPDRYRLSVYSEGHGNSLRGPSIYYPGVTDENFAGVISVSAGQEVTSANITIGVPDQTYEAVGHTADERGKPIANAMYLVYDVSDSGARADFGVPGYTDASGEFRIRGLSPGRHAVAVVADDHSSYCGDPVVFEIGAANVTGLGVQAHVGATVSGVAVVEGTDDPRALAELSLVRLNVMSHGKDDAIRIVNLPSDGTFKATGLTSGRLLFMLNPQSTTRDFSIVRIERDGLPQKGDVNISDGEQLSGVRVVLAYGAGVVRGHLTIKGGLLPEGAEVLVGAKPTSGDLLMFRRNGVADVRGRFEIHSLVDGQYNLTAYYFWGNKVVQGQPSQTITVSGGSAADTNVTLDLSKTQ
jgi:hypothetical protein